MAGPRNTRHVSPLLAGIAVAAALQLAGCGLNGPAYKSAPDPVAVTVAMTNSLDFAPSEVRVKVGQTVEWRNRSLFTHTVTANPTKAKNPEDVSLPRGAKPFSARVPPGGVYRRIFTVPGTYRYTCVPHEDDGMLGKIVVEPAA